MKVGYASVYRVILRLENRGSLACWWGDPDNSFGRRSAKDVQAQRHGAGRDRQLTALHVSKAAQTSAILTYLKEHGHDDDQPSATPGK